MRFAHTTAAIVATYAVLALATAPQRAQAARRPRAARIEQRQLTLRVVDVSGDRAYLDHGDAAGLRPGSRVTIEGRTYRVISATAEYAAIAIEPGQVARGALARAQVRLGDEADDAGEALGRVRPLEEYRGAWPATVRPAETQSPKPVPLSLARESAMRAALQHTTATVVPFSGGDVFSRGALRARVYGQPLPSAPAFALAADAAVQYWALRSFSNVAGSDSRPTLLLRELQLRYGMPDQFAVSGGRLTTAAAMVGPLDGLRAESPSLQGFSVAVFGGALPDPLSMAPAFDAGRFGAELTYRNWQSAARPELHLVTRGSVFEGRLDERRIAASVMLLPGTSRVSANAELAAFDAANPWGANTVQLLSASADGSVRFGKLTLGARLDMRKPDRSRYLDSLLPAGWLCSFAGGPTLASSVTPSCQALGTKRYWGALDASYAFGKMVLSGGATLASVPGDTRLAQRTGYAQLSAVDIAGLGRAHVQIMNSRSSLLDTLALHAGAGGWLVRERLDLELYYRPSLNSYEADVDTWLEHRFGTDVSLPFHPAWNLDFNSELVTGADYDALFVGSSMVWRPL